MHPTEILCIRAIQNFLSKGWPNNMSSQDLRSMNKALDTYKQITGKDAKVDDFRIVNFVGDRRQVPRR
jgi:hypothetical protein